MGNLVDKKMFCEKAKETLIDILNQVPESTETIETGTVVFTCLMDSTTGAIDLKGGYSGYRTPCMVAIAGLIIKLSQGIGCSAEETLKDVEKFVNIIVENTIVQGK